MAVGIGVGIGINRPRSGYVSPTAHNLKRCSRRAARYAPYIRSCETPCARTSSLSNSYYVCIATSSLIAPSSLSFSIHPSGFSIVLQLTTETIYIASNPPPRDLKVSDPAVRDLTLGELGLAPSSILHLRFVEDGLNRSYPFLRFLFPPVRGGGCPCCRSPLK
jgi:hypothetical protein